MVRIEILRDQDNNIKGYTIKGHANWDESGKDIVCSAISALGYTGIGALLNLAGGCDYSADDGLMKCIIKDDISLEHKKSAEIILK